MSDHFSGPAVIGDPAVDITDFYAFPSPERPGNLVLIMNVFPMATSQSFFSDVVTHRFRLRPLTRSGGSISARCGGTHDRRHFQRCPGRARFRKVTSSHPTDATASFVAGKPFEQDGDARLRGTGQRSLLHGRRGCDSHGLCRGRLSFETATNTVQHRDVLSIVVEVPFAPIVERFNGATLIGAIAENIVTRRGKPIRIERLGRPEIKNVILANSSRDPRATGVELRDLYNREDAFALSEVYRPLYESRLDANLAFFDALDGKIAWPPGPDGRHPLRDLLMGDFLVLDLAHAFAPGGFLEIERSLINNRPHESAGGRWLDDDILDELLTLHGEWRARRAVRRRRRCSHQAGQPDFPYVREPNKRTDLPLPAFLRS